MEKTRARLGVNAGRDPCKKVVGHGKRNARLQREKSGDKGEVSLGKEKDSKRKAEIQKNKAYLYEARKPLVCFRCQEPGHISAGCRKSSGLLVRQ